MKFNAQCKAEIDSMNSEELRAYVDFLIIEIERHSDEVHSLLEDNLDNRKCIAETTSFGEDATYLLTTIKLNQSAIYRHRQDIAGTRECILRAEDRMDLLRGEQ